MSPTVIFIFIFPSCFEAQDDLQEQYIFSKNREETSWPKVYIIVGNNSTSSLDLDLPVTKNVQEMTGYLVSQSKGVDDRGGIIQELERQNNAVIQGK